MALTIQIKQADDDRIYVPFSSRFLPITLNVTISGSCSSLQRLPPCIASLQVSANTAERCPFGVPTSGPAPEVRRLATTCASQILSSPPALRRREQRTNWIGDFANRVRGPKNLFWWSSGQCTGLSLAIPCPSGRSPTGRSLHRRGAGGGRTVGITHVVANQSPRHRAGGAQRQRNSPRNTVLGLPIVCKRE